MAAAKCATCGYSLEGLKPNSSRRVVCPECSFEQPTIATDQRWRGTRACLVTSLVVQLPLFAVMLAVGLWVPATGATLVPLSFGAPVVIGSFAGGFAGYRAACRKDSAARGSSVAYVWAYVVSFIFNGLIWLVVMAIGFLVMLSMAKGQGW